VVDSAGNPVESAWIRKQTIDINDTVDTELCECGIGQTAADGTLDIKDLGDYRLLHMASKMGVGKSEKIWVYKGDLGQTTEVLFRLKPELSSLKSVVLAMETGKPIPGAKCEVIQNGNMFYTSASNRDAYGALTITGIPTDDYNVVISAPGYNTVSRSVVLKPGQTHVMEDVLFHAATLDVTLLDEKGNPAYAGTIYLEPIDVVPKIYQKPLMAKDGRVLETGIAPGTYKMRVSSAASLTEEKEIKLLPGETKVFTFRLKRDPRFGPEYEGRQQ
jgi:hypothetical protein